LPGARVGEWVMEGPLRCAAPSRRAISSRFLRIGFARRRLYQTRDKLAGRRAARVSFQVVTYPWERGVWAKLIGGRELAGKGGSECSAEVIGMHVTVIVAAGS
jgi:hypothetical protein